jgi:hypothetical protein
MTVDANPKSVQTGDPITVTSTVTGRGNFDRINAPALEDERGWHKYPPSSKFTQDDDVGISGAKNFETVLSPNETKQTIPPLVFSFFDPAKENYVTLRNDAIPIRVEGSAVAGASVTPAAPASAPSATAARSTSLPPPIPAAAASPKPQDILYQLTERPAQPQSFTPLYRRSTFWFAQIFPLVGLIGLVAWRVRRSRLDNREAQRTAALQHEMSDLMRKLRQRDVSSQEYFAQASRAIRVKTALAGKVEPNVVDAEIAASVFRLDENSRMQLRHLFEQSDEARYSGAGNGADNISAESKQATLDLIESLRT